MNSDSPAQSRSDGALRHEFGPFALAMASRFFTPVRFASKAEEELARLSQQGFVVHVMRTSAWINYLYLTWALIKHRLPPVRAAVNLRRWLSKPWRRVAARGELDVRFAYARKHGGSALIFLKRALIGTARGRAFKDDPFPALLAFARRNSLPIYLVPELFVWEKASQSLRPRLFDYLLGSPEAPGPLYTLAAFLRNYRRAQFRVGDAIDLKRFMEDHPGDSDSILARKVRSALHHHLARETRAVFGPPRKSTDRLIEEALRDRTLRTALQEGAAAQARPLEEVVREARRHFNAIAARPQPTLLLLIAPILKWIFNRIYAGIEVDEAGLDRAIKAATRAPVVFCPSHKSHIDYLVMSYVLYERGYSAPLVAAGANLSFFPLGMILRRGGAFFLRRSFKEDRLYTAVFKAYLKKLVRDGIHHEFFPEGGRSRTGKLLAPKLGMFAWEVEAVLERARGDLHFVPVAIDYEKVMESESYSEELSGGEKRPEDFKALLDARRVLKSKYGRIHLSFHEPISLAQFIRSRELEISDRMLGEQKRGLVQALAHHVMSGIDRVSTITPQALTAAALLSHRSPGVSAKQIAAGVRLLHRVATEESRPLSPVLKMDTSSDPTAPGPIQEAMRGFILDEMVQPTEIKGETLFIPVDSKRPALAFYKNTLINLVAPLSLVSLALLAESGHANEGDVDQRALFLSRLFKFEFTYRVGTPFNTLFFEAVETLCRWGLMQRDSGRLAASPQAGDRSHLLFLADLLREYVECYFAGALTLRELSAGQLIDRRAFVQSAMDTARRELLTGRTSTPESVSKPMVENCVTFFLDQHLLEEQGKRLRLQSSLETSAVEAFTSQLQSNLIA